MKKKIGIMIALMLITLGTVSGASIDEVRNELPVYWQTNWANPILAGFNETLDLISVSHNEDGTTKNNSITAVMLDLTDITNSDFTNDADFATNTNVKSVYYNKTEMDTALANIGNWDTAFGWGDHSGLYDIVGSATIAETNANTYADANDADTQLSETEVDSYVSNNGYLTSYAETDPVFSIWDKSTGISITESQISDLSQFSGLMRDLTIDNSETIYLHSNADNYAGIKLFVNSTGAGIFRIYGQSDARMTIAIDNNPAYTETPTNNRGIISVGGNGAWGGQRSSVELQSPDQIRITAVDDVLNNGQVRIASDTTIEFFTRASAEVDSVNRLVIDNVGSDMTISNPAGSVLISGGYTGTCGAGTTLTVVGGVITGCA